MRGERCARLGRHEKLGEILTHELVRCVSGDLAHPPIDVSRDALEIGDDESFGETFHDGAETLLGVTERALARGLSRDVTHRDDGAQQLTLRVVELLAGRETGSRRPATGCHHHLGINDPLAAERPEQRNFGHFHRRHAIAVKERVMFAPVLRRDVFGGKSMHLSQGAIEERELPLRIAGDDAVGQIFQYRQLEGVLALAVGLGDALTGDVTDHHGDAVADAGRLRANPPRRHAVRARFGLAVDGRTRHRDLEEVVEVALLHHGGQRIAQATPNEFVARPAQ